MTLAYFAKDTIQLTIWVKFFFHLLTETYTLYSTRSIDTQEKRKMGKGKCIRYITLLTHGAMRERKCLMHVVSSALRFWPEDYCYTICGRPEEKCPAAQQVLTRSLWALIHRMPAGLLQKDMVAVEKWTFTVVIWWELLGVMMDVPEDLSHTQKMTPITSSSVYDGTPWIL